MTRKEALELLNNRVVTGPQGHKTFGILETLEVLGLIKFDDEPERVWWISNKGYYTLYGHDYNPNSGAVPGLVWFKLDKKPFDRA